ncbi:galactose-1-phosphate uridylyltransferase [Streptomyces spongiicola]|uniref:Galactose-1-phosphate uridylyltransferase n=1 Tax=Streptomyces spongiicola TaxID=1690221 RepID=A0ABN5KVH5_9ACTN|nr:galactose-1-phosphate uridylyltransferase [Streptomyces spongiicola]AWK12114.1 galactose-1-phosphate uridylyltransferase [Streptomyces spongiicola]
MKKTSTRLADGRELIYYDLRDAVVREAADRRPLERTVTTSEVRRDPLLGDTVAIASHRQGRTYHPPADECPLCPSEGDRLSEIPDSSYDVVVFENRFPSLAGDSGRCEVVCFTPDHSASFRDLSEEHARLVLEAWTDRTAELSHLPSVEQVFCFENRGAEIGVTLGHPHGQIYAYPFTTPRTALMLRSLAAHKEATGGGNLFDDLVARELAGERVVLEAEHWVAFVPYAAHWPYEVHLYPRRRVPDLLGLDEEARAEFPRVYLELLRRFDRIFDGSGGSPSPPGPPGSPVSTVSPPPVSPDSPDSPDSPGEPPTPYIAAWHQAPFGVLEEFEGVAREDFALHLELFTVRRTSGKLKFLAGSESGMGVFINDVPPEQAAERLREVAGP